MLPDAAALAVRSLLARRGSRVPAVLPRLAPALAVALPGERCMLVNENGKDGPHMINHTATAIAHEAEAIMPSDYIAGVAVIVFAESLQ